jgi:mRNA interferase MazF
VEIPNYNKKEVRKMIERGSIHWYNFGNQEGSRQSGVRPVLTTSNNLNNTYSPTIQVAPLSTRITKNLPVHVYIPKEIGLNSDSIVLLEQETTINKTDLGDYITQCPNNIMEQVDKAILIQKGIVINTTIENKINEVTEVNKNTVDIEHLKDLVWIINDMGKRAEMYPNNNYYIRTRNILLKELNMYCILCGLNFETKVAKYIRGCNIREGVI